MSLEKIELVTILDSKMLDIWSLLMLLHRYNTLDMTRITVNKLYHFDVGQIEFFLPQISHLVLFLGPEKGLPVMRLLLDICRMSMKTGLLIYFIFKAIVEENINNQKLNHFMSDDFLKLCHEAVISSNKNLEIGKYIKIYRWVNKKDKKKKDKRISYKKMRSTLRSTSLPTIKKNLGQKMKRMVKLMNQALYFY